MAFPSKPHGDNSSTDTGGEPTAFQVDFDPNDPMQLKVHYDLSGWSLDQRAELAETLAEVQVPHVWEGLELVIPDELELAVDALFDRLEAEIGPFPIALEADDPTTDFSLEEWSFTDLEAIRAALVAAKIPHSLQGSALEVPTEYEDTVDEILDRIEDNTTDDAHEEAPDEALNDLFVVADKLSRDITDSAARSKLFELSPLIDETAPPYGMQPAGWAGIVDQARQLHEAFDTDPSEETLSELAARLRAACQPFI